MKVLMRSMIAAGGLAAGLAFSAGNALATPVLLSNANFDANAGLVANSDQQETANFGNSTLPGVPGWNIVATGSPGTSGVLAPMNPGGIYFNTGANWSNQVGLINGNSSISQTSVSTFNGSAGTVTLTLSLGEALGTTLGSGGQIELLANGGLVLATGLETGGSVIGPFTAGTFTNETYTFNINSLQGAAIAGENVGLEFSNPDSTTVYLDNIALSGTNITTGSPVPEPAAGLPLLGVALLGFMAFDFRQKGQKIQAI